jgi:hypothetical protein
MAVLKPLKSGYFICGNTRHRFQLLLSLSFSFRHYSNPWLADLQNPPLGLYPYRRWRIQ